MDKIFKHKYTMGSVLFILLGGILMLLMGGNNKRTYPPTHYGQGYDWPPNYFPPDPYQDSYVRQRMWEAEQYRIKRQEDNGFGCLIFVVAILGLLGYLATCGLPQG